MTRLDLTRLQPATALSLARRLTRHAHEGLEVLVAHPGRVLCCTFGAPWPGGRGRSARPLSVRGAWAGMPGYPELEAALARDLAGVNPNPRCSPLGAAVALREWERVEEYYEGEEREDPLFRGEREPWRGRV